jgi:hypothetical protein
MGIREATVSNESFEGGRTRLIIQVSAGEVVFFVVDNAACIAAITEARR